MFEFDCRSQDDKEEKTIKGGVVKVCCSEENIIALMRDSSVRIWKRETGYLSNIIEMVSKNWPTNLIRFLIFVFIVRVATLMI